MEEREVDGDLILHDMGTGLPFRPGTFDGAIRSVGTFSNGCQFLPMKL